MRNRNSKLKNLLIRHVVLVCSLVFSFNVSAAEEFSIKPHDEVSKPVKGSIKHSEKNSPYIVVLGIAQDAGFPQAACNKDCCKEAWKNKELRRMVSCLAIVDPKTNDRWILDCTPDFPDQLRLLDEITNSKTSKSKEFKNASKNPIQKIPRSRVSGIFLTHAHIGHYTGLMHLGREVIGAKATPVYMMPRMKSFIQSNGPWSQLVTLKNIEPRDLADQKTISLNGRIKIKPFLVPHRDEFSETVGFEIQGPSRKVLFIPDIDKWEKWNTRIVAAIQKVDLAFLDGTFYGEGELPGRNMSQIPHPFIAESMKRFVLLSAKQRAKIHFIHLNHTNPALNPKSKAVLQIKKTGMNLARQGAKHDL